MYSHNFWPFYQWNDILYDEFMVCSLFLILTILKKNTRMVIVSYVNSLWFGWFLIYLGASGHAVSPLTHSTRFSKLKNCTLLSSSAVSMDTSPNVSLNPLFAEILTKYWTSSGFESWARSGSRSIDFSLWLLINSSSGGFQS